MSSVSESVPIWFTLMRIELATPRSMPRAEALGVGDEHVVADELARAEPARERSPAVPVVLGHPVLDRHEREPLAEAAQVLDPVGRREGPALTGELVGAVAIQLGGGDVDGERDVAARLQAHGGDRLDEQLEGLLVRVEARREPALVPEAGAEPAVVQQAAEAVVRLGAPAQRLPEARRADGGEHELLHVDVRVGVAAAVQDVEQRHREHVRVDTAEVAVERQPGLVRRRLRHGERHREERVRTEPALVRGAVQYDELVVEEALVRPLEARDRVGDLTVDVSDGGRTPWPP